MKETKKETFKSLEDLKKRLEQDEKNAKCAVENYQSLLNSAFGPMPRTQLELVRFIEKVLEYKK